jgi:uncharacterized protein
VEVSRRYMPYFWALPEVTEFNRGFFTTGELQVQRCTSCGSVQHPPIDVCIACQSFEFEYIKCAPYGTVESYTVVHHPIHELLKDVLPYNVVVVALDDFPHVRIVGNVVDAAPSGVAIGDRVKASWAKVEVDDGPREIWLPQWQIVA